MAVYSVVRNIAGCTLCIIALSACQIDEKKPIFSGLFDRQTHESFSGKFIDVADQRRVSQAAALPLPGKQASAEDKLLTELQGKLRENKPLENAAPLVSYAEGILFKLAAAWAGPAPAPKVIVTADPSYAARVFPDGTVLIAQGLFVSADSEDELAFVLAHELSHVLLNHSEAEQHITQRQEVINLAGVAALAATSQSSKNQTAGTNILLGYLAVHSTNEFLLAPSWRREQEDEADLLGLDIASKAGYSYAASFRAMQRLKDQATRTAVKKNEATRAFNTQIERAMASGQMDKGMNMALGELANAPTKLFQALGDSLKESHPDPQKREASLRAYVRREYSDVFPQKLQKEAYQQVVFSGPALQALTRSVLTQWANSLIDSGKYDDADVALREVLRGPRDSDPDIRLSLYRLSLKRNRNHEALQHLEIAARDRRAGEEVFALLAQEYLSQGQSTKAIATSDILVRRFGPEYFPLRIRLLAEARQTKELNLAIQQCRATGRPALTKDCEQAAVTSTGKQPL
jgi:predicted Zn-dependent protease